MNTANSLHHDIQDSVISKEQAQVPKWGLVYDV